MLLISCGGGPQPDAPLFPAAAGPWKLKQSADVAPDQVPEPIRRLGIRRAGDASYEGAGTLKVQVYELTSSAAAFEAEQQWRPIADTVAFHKENLFTVVHWENADRTACTFSLLPVKSDRTCRLEPIEATASEDISGEIEAAWVVSRNVIATTATFV